MVKRIAAVGMVTFVLAGGAVCQNAMQSLPDAPSVQAATLASGVSVLAGQIDSPFKFDAAGSLPHAARPDAFRDPDTTTVRGQKESNTLLARYFYAASPKQQASDHAADSTFMGRATHAAAGIFFTRDEAGRGRVNTSYFLRALTLVAADTGSRPYWRRSATGPFSDFGSTVGNDAGMNLLHEFGPGIQHLAKSHAPKFVARIIGQRLSRN
jgi:hypothetical protein